MKRLLIILSCILSAFSACVPARTSDKSSGKLSKSQRIVPFYDLEWQEAKELAEAENKRLMLLIVQDAGELEGLKEEIGIHKGSIKQWNRDFISIALDAQDEEAKRLMEMHYVQALPACLKFTRKDQDFEGVLYGRVWPSNKAYASASPTRKLLKVYEAGNKDRKLLLQILDHLPYLKLDVEEYSDLKFRLTNDYLNSFSLEEFTTHELPQGIHRYKLG